MHLFEDPPDRFVFELVEGVQVPSKRPREQQGVLRNNRDFGSEGPEPDLGDVDTIDVNAARRLGQPEEGGDQA